MHMEKSCGAVVFTLAGERLRYVIIRSPAGICGFPKGHVEGKETERETALREIREETGLRVRLLDGFREETSYPIQRQGGLPATKQVIYFLAEFRDQIPVAQESEVSEIRLLEYSAAMEALKYENTRQILCRANDHLNRLFSRN